MANGISNQKSQVLPIPVADIPIADIPMAGPACLVTVHLRELQVQQSPQMGIFAHPKPALLGPVALEVASFSYKVLVVIKMTLQHLFPKKRSVIDSSGHCQVQIKVITAAPSLSSFSLCSCPCSLLALQCCGNFCWPCQKCLMSLRWG